MKPITALGVILLAISLLILFTIMAVNLYIIKQNSGTELVNRTIDETEHECFVLRGATYCCIHEPDYKIINANGETYVTQCTRFSTV